jgi:multiple sugar transport system permease protein/sn-glycerol 3-phosphate transport system permease protein
VNAWLSLVRWNFLSAQQPFVGLANYAQVLDARAFLDVVRNTTVFTVTSVIITMGCGLLLAILLDQRLRWRTAARAVLFTPTVLAGSAIAIVWIYIFDPRFGLLQQTLAWIDVASPNWLADPAWAMAAIVIVYSWKHVGYAVVIYLAGLQAIDRTLYEVAAIDGAGPFEQFRAVTLPGLSPMIFFLMVTSVLACFQAFDIIHVMTEGGPVNATNTLVYHLYEQGFVRTQAGPAGVVAMVMFGAMILLTWLQLRYAEARVHYA